MTVLELLKEVELALNLVPNTRLRTVKDTYTLATAVGEKIEELKKSGTTTDRE